MSASNAGSLEERNAFLAGLGRMPANDRGAEPLATTAGAAQAQQESQSGGAIPNNRVTAQWHVRV